MLVLFNVFSYAFFRTCRYAAAYSRFSGYLLILNYISSVGSLVSVFGVFVFFWLLADVYLINSLFFQIKNTYYVIILNNWFIRNTELFSFTKNTYVFVKYNFFSVYNKHYFFLDKFILSSFLRLVSIFTINTTNLNIFKQTYSIYANLPEVFNVGVENVILTRMLFLTQGWFQFLWHTFFQIHMATLRYVLPSIYYS